MMVVMKDYFLIMVKHYATKHYLPESITSCIVDLLWHDNTQRDVSNKHSPPVAIITQVLQ